MLFGNKEILNNKGIAIIGSRDCTEEGKQNARLFSSNIAKSGFSVISGMAKGIDATAHSGALEVKGKTIAVLGCGPKCIFPPENRYIYETILKMGGAIVSEYPGSTRAESERFRQRNRIISGLSLGVLVIEAEYRSGTTITARFAKEQGRDVFCIPNSITNKKGRGTNILLQKGAKLVLQPKEIIEGYTGEKAKQISIEELEENKKSEITYANGIKEEYKELYSFLAKGFGINEIIINTGINLQELYEMLFLMEIDGIIKNVNGKYEINGK